MAELNDLDNYIREREQRSRGFAELVEAAERRRAFARQLASERKKRKLSQTLIAARMGTSPSMVIRVESGADVKLSTMERYMAALGSQLELQMGSPRRGSRARRRSAHR